MKNKKKSSTGRYENRSDHANSHRNLQGSNQGHTHLGNRDNSKAPGDHTGYYGNDQIIDITDLQKKSMPH